MATTTSSKHVNFQTWLSENEAFFQPPVCNRMMFKDGQLKVMYVSGPNIRKDYHVEMGEELFLQVRGRMLLETWERGARKSVWIEEGEVFVLPGRVPHSPNRFADTLGLVVERERAADELDVLRYYVDDDGGGDRVLYQEVFHCEDLGSQLVPVIKRFFASDEHRTGVPDPAKLPYRSPFPLNDDVVLEPPFRLADAIDRRIADEPVFWLFERPEFRVRVRRLALDDDCLPASEKLVVVHQGSCTLVLPDQHHHRLNKQDHFLVPLATRHRIAIDSSDAILLEIWMIPPSS